MEDVRYRVQYIKGKVRVWLKYYELGEQKRKGKEQENPKYIDAEKLFHPVFHAPTNTRVSSGMKQHTKPECITADAV